MDRRSNERSELLVTSAFPREGVTAAVLFPAASLLWGNGLWVPLVVAAVAPLVLVAWLRKSGAGYYAKRGRGLVCLGGGTEGDERDADIVHELGHRMQDVVPGLVEHEREFLEKKMGRTVRSYPLMIAAWGRLLRGLGDAGLLPGARGDVGAQGFYHPYAAFDPLDGRAFEVFMMGYQGLLYGAKDPRTGEYDPGTRPHTDHCEFVERALREL